MHRRIDEDSTRLKSIVIGTVPAIALRTQHEPIVFRIVRPKRTTTRNGFSSAFDNIEYSILHVVPIRFSRHIVNWFVRQFYVLMCAVLHPHRGSCFIRRRPENYGELVTMIRLSASFFHQIE